MAAGTRIAAAIVLVGAATGVAWWLARQRADPTAAVSAPLESSDGAPTTPVDAQLERANVLAAEPVASAATSDARSAIEASPPAEAVAAASAPVATLRVLVRAKEDGAPIAGVRLMVADAEGHGSCSHVEGPDAARGECPVTGPDGRASLAVDPNQIGQVRAWGRRWKQQVRDFPALDAGESHELVFDVPTREDARLFGQLLDADTEEPVPGSVRFERGGAGTSAVETDADGRFELAVASWEDAWASATAEEYSRTVFRASEMHGDSMRTLVVRLSRAASLAVTVREPGGAAIDGARIELATDSYRIAQPASGTLLLDSYFADDPTWHATTGSDGRALVRELAPRVPLRLSVSARGWPERFEAEAILLEPGERRDLLMTLGRGATISGRLEDGLGAPITNRAIWRRVAEYDAPDFFETYDEPVDIEVTNAEGRFEMTSVPAGRWWIGPAPSDDDVPALAQVVVVESEGARIEIALRADRGLYVRGRVLGPAGTPVPDCGVRARSESGLPSIWEHTDAAGEFSIGPLPAATWTLTAGGMLDEYAESEPVDVRAGTEAVVLVVRSGGSIAGEVIDVSSGEPVEAEVTLVLQDAEERSWVTTMGRPDGTFEFAGLSNGAYALVARTRDGTIGAQGPVDVDDGTRIDGVRVELSLGARLVLAYVGAAPAAQCAVYVDGLRLAESFALRTEVETVIVPPGNIEVRWTDREDQRSLRTEKLALRAGDERRLELRTAP